MPSLRATRPGLVDRRDLLLPRGVWQLVAPSDRVRVFLLVTSTGKMMLHRVPESLFGEGDEVAAAVYDALTEKLQAIDPQLRLVQNDPVPPSPGATRSPLAQRIMTEFGLV